MTVLNSLTYADFPRKMATPI